MAVILGLLCFFEAQHQGHDGARKLSLPESAKSERIPAGSEKPSQSLLILDTRPTNPHLGRMHTRRGLDSGCPA